MKLPRRKFLNLAMGATALSALSDTALALDYPTRPVHWIIGFPPGGGADIVARILGAWLAERIDQQVIVEKPSRRRHEYRDRVRGALGPRRIHTTVGWGKQRDQREHLLRPVVRFSQGHRARFGRCRLSAGDRSQSAGPGDEHRGVDRAREGQSGQADARFLWHRDDIAGRRRTVQIARRYRDGAHPLQGWRPDADRSAEWTRERIRSGAVRALATLGPKRLDALPDVPTLAETFPGYEAVAFTGVGVPRGTPPEVIARLNREINAGLADPGLRKRFDDLTVTPLIFTPAEFGAYMTSKTEKWAKVIKAANIKVN